MILVSNGDGIHCEGLPAMYDAVGTRSLEIRWP